MIVIFNTCHTYRFSFPSRNAMFFMSTVVKYMSEWIIFNRFGVECILF
ncbi:hypothetical protein HMPREF3033_01595 [Veillonellaceae bacterium DNF00751]|nr:hypothetical protein HMPREF3033_01595 [Veillonellaceae bacterium DNF00751]